MKKVLFTLFFALLAVVGRAYDAEIDGIYYFLDSSQKTAVVTCLYTNSSNKDVYTGDVVIPESVSHNGLIYTVTSIGDYAFSYCSDMTSIEIPNSVTHIGWNAFYNCSGLTSVTIPNSVKTIENWAFLGCTGLTSVHISDITAWCNIRFSTSKSNPLANARKLTLNGEEVKDLVIPSSITSIGQYAFYYCSSLTTLTIPESVSSIDIAAFFDCFSLTDIFVEAATPPVFGNFVFNTESDDETVYNTTVLHVPEGKKDIYSSAYGWMNFINIVDYQTNGIEDVSGSMFTVSGSKSRKLIENGSIVILKDGEKYAIDGKRIY